MLRKEYKIMLFIYFFNIIWFLDLVYMRYCVSFWGTYISSYIF